MNVRDLIVALAKHPNQDARVVVYLDDGEGEIALTCVTTEKGFMSSVTCTLLAHSDDIARGDIVLHDDSETQEG